MNTDEKFTTIEEWDAHFHPLWAEEQRKQNLAKYTLAAKNDLFSVRSSVVICILYGLAEIFIPERMTSPLPLAAIVVGTLWAVYGYLLDLRKIKRYTA